MANFIYDSITDKTNNTKQAYDIFENAVGCSSFTFLCPLKFIAAVYNSSDIPLPRICRIQLFSELADHTAH